MPQTRSNTRNSNQEPWVATPSKKPGRKERAAARATVRAAEEAARTATEATPVPAPRPAAITTDRTQRARPDSPTARPESPIPQLTRHQEDDYWPTMSKTTETPNLADLMRPEDQYPARHRHQWTLSATNSNWSRH